MKEKEENIEEVEKVEEEEEEKADNSSTVKKISLDLNNLKEIWW